MLEQAYGRQQGAHGRCAWGWEAAWGKCEGHRGNRGIYGRHCGVGGRGTLRGVGGRWEGCTQGGGRHVGGVHSGRWEAGGREHSGGWEAWRGALREVGGTAHDGRGALKGVGGTWAGSTQGGGRQVVGERAEHSKHGMGGVKNVVWSM